MKKSAIIVFTAFLLGINIWGYSDPSNSYQWLLASNSNLEILRYLLAAFLIAHLFMPQTQHRITRLLVVSAGIIAFIVTLGSALFIPYGEPLHVSMYPLDFIASFEGAVILTLIGLQTVTTKKIVIKHQPLLNFAVAKQS